MNETELLGCCLCLFVFLTSIEAHVNSSRDENTHDEAIDANGYIIYCPCMGRFGNRAEHFLGALAFAKQIDRTLVLPPWPTERGHIPFDEWFRVEALESYHRVITAANFMEYLAPILWPVGSRVGMCYMPWNKKHETPCDLTGHSPGGPFWNHLDISFDKTVYYSLTYSKEDKYLWKKEFPVSEFPVLALKGAPASFPAQENHRELQKYLWWTNDMMMEASTLTNSFFKDEKYIALHLRNGEDWKRACGHAIGHKGKFMSSPQCLGYKENKIIPQDMCLPTVQEIIAKVKQAVERSGIKNIYIATDALTYQRELQVAFNDDSEVSIIHGDPAIPQIDLIAMAQAEIFIGNCISSFTAFVVRDREFVYNKSSSFFGID